jgi:hypothetical protein
MSGFHQTIDERRIAHMKPEPGQWFRVISGPQRNATGVFDLERTFPTGTVYRLVDPVTKVVVGRFRAEQLEPTSAPQHEPIVTGAPRQAALDMLTVRRT